MDSFFTIRDSFGGSYTVSFINIYKNNPTEGGTDGTQVDVYGVTEPIQFILSSSDTQIIKLAIRTEPHYRTTGETVIRAYTGDLPQEALRLSWQRDGEYTSTISTTDTITNANKIFYAMSVSENETPNTYRAMSIIPFCTLELGY